LPDSPIDLRIGPAKLANIDTSNRLIIPRPTFSNVSWRRKEAQKVFAELVSPGLVRIYLASDIEEKIRDRLSSLSEMPFSDQFDRQMVLADRYRPMKLDKEGRLQLTQDIVPILGFSLNKDQPSLFVQPFGNGFEILSVLAREQRLIDSMDQTLGIHLDGVAQHVDEQIEKTA
jgi:DNA-binding transcriptional regulator/RsmH inhibitor MraZ